MRLTSILSPLAGRGGGALRMTSYDPHRGCRRHTLVTNSWALPQAYIEVRAFGASTYRDPFANTHVDIHPTHINDHVHAQAPRHCSHFCLRTACRSECSRRT